MLEKFKSLFLNDHIFFGLLIVFVGLGSFMLGRASVSQPEQLPALSKVGEQSGSVSQSIDSEITVKKEQSGGFGGDIILVASKSGTKYHLESCPGSKQIKDANKIFFSSREEAEAAGYKPAANCPGLQ